MAVVQCKLCKKLFQDNLGRGQFCPGCVKKMDDDFIKVREYIYQHELADVDEVSEETGVSVNVILHLLKEGRIMIGGSEDDGGGLLVCEMCKKPINAGRLCKACKANFSSQIKSRVAPPPQTEKKNLAKPSTAKMHTADDRRR